MQEALNLVDRVAYADPYSVSACYQQLASGCGLTASDPSNSNAASNTNPSVGVELLRVIVCGCLADSERMSRRWIKAGWTWLRLGWTAACSAKTRRCGRWPFVCCVLCVSECSTPVLGEELPSCVLELSWDTACLHPGLARRQRWAPACAKTRGCHLHSSQPGGGPTSIPHVRTIQCPCLPQVDAVFNYQADAALSKSIAFT